MPENHNPDVIYLEADSEITEAIDQLKASTGHEVRLAVPGRSTMLQSAVNLKLLKKTASTAHKQLVLISTDKATLSLAAGLGLMVAKNVKAEAIVPDMTMLPPEVSNEPVVIEQSAQEASDLSKLSRNSKKSKNADSAGSFEKQHIDLAEEELVTPPHHSQPLEGDKKSPKVPNFTGLNKKIAIIASVIGGIILLILAYIFLPTAKATLIAKAQKTPVSVKFSLDASTRKSDYNQGLVAANQLSVTMDLSAQYTATGKKDVGSKASGSIIMKNASSSSPVTVPSGTTVVSDGKNFTLNQAVTIPGASVSAGKIVPGTASVAITAAQNGDSYNFASAAFLVSGYTGLTANGSTSGGISKIATVITQTDIDKAKKDMIDAATQRAKQEVEAKANSDEHAFAETFTADATGITTSVPVDTESSGGTVSAKVKYTELAATKSDLDKVFSAQIKTQIPANNQIYQSGSVDAKYDIKLSSADKADISAISNAYYGQTIDIQQVAKDLTGKSKKDATDAVKPSNPQVNGVQIETSPALMPYLPFFANRINVQIQVSTN